MPKERLRICPGHTGFVMSAVGMLLTTTVQERSFVVSIISNAAAYLLIGIGIVKKPAHLRKHAMVIGDQSEKRI